MTDLDAATFEGVAFLGNTLAPFFLQDPAKGDAAEAFERLPIVQDAAILQNILYSGVWTRFEAAFRTKQEEPT